MKCNQVSVKGHRGATVHLIEISDTSWEVGHYKVMIKHHRRLSESQTEDYSDGITIFTIMEHQSNT